AQRMLPRQSTAHVHHGRCGEKCSTIIAATVTTRHKYGTNERQANLTAMHVARKHQVHFVTLCPADVVGRVTEAESKSVHRIIKKTRSRLEPRPLMADHNHWLGAYEDLSR